MTDRDRYLAKLSPPELLLYVAGGGQLVTRAMDTGYTDALRWLAAQVAKTVGPPGALSAERIPEPSQVVNVNMDSPIIRRRSCSADQRQRARLRAKAKRIRRAA